MDGQPEAERVWVVLVDWGTADGYQDHVQLHDVFAQATDAHEAAERCRSLPVNPAVFVRVEERILR